MKIGRVMDCRLCRTVGESALRAAVSLTVVLVFILFVSGAFNAGIKKGFEVGFEVGTSVTCPKPQKPGLRVPPSPIEDWPFKGYEDWEA